ncbi:sugar-binding domain-containing protein [Paradesertivirga mongoliensis]|uniref:Sugar-binding domain-containing protein n=1 Tax=Paradesertivirga mongoliensis TaxID=2100740 RepID=A0ABW4ZKU4_9SPHI|nr:sugar-binding domain-containing protein [Pedobacter mongoliensis]
MKKLAVFCFLLCVSTAVGFAQSRVKYNFNPGWKLMREDVKGAEVPDYNDATWENITLPHAWNEDDAFRKNIFEHTIGIVWYRKRFRVPATDRGKKVFLEFEGVRQAGEFYLNGKFIGLHENGAMAFGFDVTDLIKQGEDNVIAVRIDNSWDYLEKASQVKFQWADRNFNANYGGLPKNVWLHVSDKLYQTLPLYAFLKTTGVYVYAKDFDIPAKTATVVTESQVKNDYNSSKTFQYEVIVKDLGGNTVKTFDGGKTTIKPGETKIVSANAPLSNLNFWSWGYGYLYTVTTRLKVSGTVVDEVNTKTGFRKAEFKNGMVYLNDRVLMMKGYAQRTSNEWPAIGLSVPPWMSDYSNGLMVESNANLVRWMHITPWKQDVESCDRVGLIQAMPAGDAEHDVTGPRWTQRTNLMREAIIYNRNNPSILFYECGNESISDPHMAEMKAIRDQYDPHGGRAIGSREMLDSKIAEYGGEMLYTNKSARIPMWQMEYSRDEGLRKYWDEFSPPYHKDGVGPLYRNAPAGQYNRNQDSHALEDVVRWYEFWRERPGTGTRVNSGGVNIIFSDSNTHYRGSENYRRSGEVDALRIPKDGFYAHQLMWDGWVDVEKHRTHIIGHWNYQPGTKKNIYVLGTGDKAELFINGQSKGFGERRDGFIFTFRNIEWQPGSIKAVSYDAQNNKLSEKELKTAGAPHALKLTAMQGPLGLRANGADVAIVQVEVVDAQGNRCPTALNTVDFNLEGNAEWRGGLAQGAENFILSKFLPVEGGVNRVLIRSTITAGPIKLSAISEGLKPAALQLTSSPVKVIDGLSLEMPYDGLKPSLKRGPTPSGLSFTPSRIALKIIDATAGANAAKAKATYDDSELSDWVNDNKLSTAWIKYTLEKEATVNEVTLKMNNFASRTYPIKILVDDKEVFKGTTYRSQGYCTLQLKPASGKTVTIQLFNPNSGKDESSISVELGGKKLDDGVARNDGGAREILSIIEAEIYTKPGN